jgi:hypothetical protein
LSIVRRQGQTVTMAPVEFDCDVGAIIGLSPYDDEAECGKN